MPGATVTVRNEATGVEIVLVDQRVGRLHEPAAGARALFRHGRPDGFQEEVSSGILLQGGDAIRQDVALQVGDLTESVEVKGASGISETRPDVSHTVDEKYYQDLPFVTGSDVRLAESVLQMQPGYLPMRPNGDPMFRGSQFNSRINGGQAMATENFFDGAAFGYASGHQQSHESTPPVEAIQEVKVISTTYSAQYGHTSGGFIEYTSKAGTNKFHGSGYGYFADDAFNKNAVFAERAARRRRSATTTTASRSAARHPHRTRRSSSRTSTTRGSARAILPGFGNTTPIDAFKNGDFGALLTGNQIGTDALGRPIFRGQIFDPADDPAGQRHPRARSVSRATSFPPITRCAASSPREIVPLMVRPDRDGLANNVAGIGTGDQTWELDARNILGRLDHNFSPDFKSSTSFYWNRRPSVRNCGGRGRVQRTKFDPETESGAEHRLLRQRVLPAHLHAPCAPAVRLGHQQQPVEPLHDRVGPLVHGRQSPVGRVRTGRSGCGGTASTGGLVAQDAGPPTMRFNGGNIPYTPIGLEGWPRFGYEKNDRWQFSNDITWVRGRHTIKTGFEFRHHNFPSSGWGAGGAAGNFNFDRLGTAGYDAAGNNLEPDRRSVRVLPAGAGPDVESDHSGVHRRSARPIRRRGSTTSSRYPTS